MQSAEMQTKLFVTSIAVVEKTVSSVIFQDVCATQCPIDAEKDLYGNADSLFIPVK
jgi:hypothetical protein